jgi:hypothetical protein
VYTLYNHPPTAKLNLIKFKKKCMLLVVVTIVYSTEVCVTENSLLVKTIYHFRAELSGASDEICALLGYYAASCGNCLPTFRDVSVPSSRVKGPSRKALDSWPVKMGPTRSSETSVNSYHTTPRNIPEECRSHQHCGGSLKSRLTLVMFRKTPFRCCC